jgi:hypothetical protein
MQTDELRRRSRWLMRVMEWDDARARYPNIWHEEMPRHVLAFDRVATRLRLGDLIVVFSPASQKHSQRSEKFLGISRVAGLRMADTAGFAWIDLETAHRFQPPLDIGQQPRRVFLCCDPGWPEPEVNLFRRVFDAAVAAGWKPTEEDAEGPAPGHVRPETVAEPQAVTTTEPVETLSIPIVAETEPTEPKGRLFAGVDYSGDMRDPREATWLSIVELREDRLRVVRLEPTGRHGLQGYLRDPDTSLMNVEAIGLDFPFGLPIDFAEKIMGGPCPEEGWWALAKKLERVTRPDYLVAVQEHRDELGESKRLTDERVSGFSPLHRVNPDLGPMTYHGIRMIAEDRSRYAVKPFESAQGKLLLEVYPGGFVKRLTLPPGEGDGRDRRRHILNALGGLDYMPIELQESMAKSCLARRDALDAVIAARLSAVAVLSGEVERAPDDLAPGEGERVRREGWIYGLQEPA